MPRLRTRLSCALAATAVVAGAVALATLADTAAPRTARADAAPGHSHGHHFHGDPLDAGSRWSDAGASITDLAPAIPSAWCGGFGAADDTVNEVAQSGPKWHVVVAVPSDVWAHPNFANGGRERLADQAYQSVTTIETFYKLRVGTGNIGQPAHGWTLRFDYGTSCGPQYPDISLYPLPRTQAQYTAEPYSGVVRDLDASNLYERADKRYLVHYAGNSVYCGQSYIYAPTDNTGGARYSITYNLDGIALATASVPCDWTTDAHEMGHSMGAATGGPLNNDGAHTWDCYNDVMSYGGTVCGDGQLYFDWREDNYFGHTGAWNDTDVSGFWCKPAC